MSAEYKTLHQYLKETDREELLKCYIAVCEPDYMFSPDRTVKEIQDAEKKSISELIDNILAEEPEASDYVFVVYEGFREGFTQPTVALLKTDELGDDSWKKTYSFESMRLAVLGGCRIFDTILFQNNRNEVLSFILDRVAMFGISGTEREKTLDRIGRMLKESAEAENKGPLKSLEDVREHFYQLMGMTYTEPDPKERELVDHVNKAKIEHDIYCLAKVAKELKATLN